MPLQLKNAINSLAPLLVFSLLITSCSHKSDSNEAVIQAMKESLEISNRSINRSTATLLKSLEEKSKDYCTEERAAYWYPVAESIANQSRFIYDYIETIKSAQFIKEATLDSLKEKIKNYKVRYLRLIQV